MICLGNVNMCADLRLYSLKSIMLDSINVCLPGLIWFGLVLIQGIEPKGTLPSATFPALFNFDFGTGSHQVAEARLEFVILCLSFPSHWVMINIFVKNVVITFENNLLYIKHLAVIK